MYAFHRIAHNLTGNDAFYIPSSTAQPPRLILIERMTPSPSKSRATIGPHSVIRACRATTKKVLRFKGKRNGEMKMSREMRSDARPSTKHIDEQQDKEEDAGGIGRATGTRRCSPEQLPSTRDSHVAEVRVVKRTRVPEDRHQPNEVRKQPQAELDLKNCAGNGYGGQWPGGGAAKSKGGSGSRIPRLTGIEEECLARRGGEGKREDRDSRATNDLDEVWVPGSAPAAPVLEQEPTGLYVLCTFGSPSTSPIPCSLALRSPAKAACERLTEDWGACVREASRGLDVDWWARRVRDPVPEALDGKWQRTREKAEMSEEDLGGGPSPPPSPSRWFCVAKAQLGAGRARHRMLTRTSQPRAQGFGYSGTRRREKWADDAGASADVWVLALRAEGPVQHAHLSTRVISRVPLGGDGRMQAILARYGRSMRVSGWPMVVRQDWYARGLCKSTLMIWKSRFKRIIERRNQKARGLSRRLKLTGI
ncbi:hypothetical protein B0H13DRAFT_2529834 [Mycena leptocephala]|nr:hypothetical protein B0H13DRAFT_2529834 [Mycena leptocephala]